MKVKKEHLILILILLIGTALRVFLSREITFIGVDAVSYTRLGKNLIEKGAYIFGEDYNRGIFFPPGYPLVIGVLNLFINDLFLSGEIISVISSLVAIFLLYLIGKEIYNEEAGLFAAFSFALYPSLLSTSILVSSEALFICFMALSIYLTFILIKKNSLFYFILLGVSIGMAYLTRSEGLLLLALPFLHVLSSGMRENKQYLIKVSVALIVFALIASPYILFLKNATGKFNLSGKNSYLSYLMQNGVTGPGFEFDKVRFILNDEKNKIKSYDEAYKTSGTMDLIREPADFIKRYVKNAIAEAKVLLILLVPILLPVIFAFFDKDLFRRKELIFIIFPLVFLLIYPLYFIDERQVLLALLPIILFSSIGFANSSPAVSFLLNYYQLEKNIITSFFEKSIKTVIVLILLLRVFVFSYDIDVPYEYIKAGYFLKNNVTSEYEKLNIMERVPWVSFYSDSRFTSIPYASPSDIINFARLYKVDYIVIGERTLNGWENYNELINMDKYSGDVELVYKDDSVKAIKLLKVKYN